MFASTPLLPTHKSLSSKSSRPSRPPHNRKPSNPSLSSHHNHGEGEGGSSAKARTRRIPVLLLSALRRLQGSRSIWKGLVILLGLCVFGAVKFRGGGGFAGEVGLGAGGGGRGGSYEDVLIEEVETMEFETARHNWNYKSGTLEIDGTAKDGRHPLYEVITRAEKEWKDKLMLQPKNLRESFATYKNNFLRRPPPKNFDKLFSLLRPSTSSLSPLLSPLPVQMYHCILGSTLRTRQTNLEASNFTSPIGGGGRMVLVVDGGKVSAEFPWGVKSNEREKAEKIVGKLQTLESKVSGGLIPDLRVTINLDLDVPPHLIPYMYAETAYDRSRLGFFEDPSDGDTWPLFTWHQTCEDFTPLRKKHSRQEEESLRAASSVPAPPSIILSPLAYSPCLFPSLMNLNPHLASPPPTRDPYPVPRLTFSKTSLGSEVLLPNILAPQPHSPPRVVPWVEKSGAKGVVWRGKAPKFPSPLKGLVKSIFGAGEMLEGVDGNFAEGLEEEGEEGSGRAAGRSTTKTTDGDEDEGEVVLETVAEKRAAQGLVSIDDGSDGRPLGTDGEISYFSPANATLSTIYRLLLLHKTPLPLNFPPVMKTKLEEGDRLVEEGEPFEMKKWTEERIVDAKLEFGEDVECGALEEGCPELIRDVEVDDDAEFLLGSDKYVFVLEGEDPTAIMLAGSLVFYASTLEQSWQQQAVPWVHYIPVHPSFANLPSLLAFLRDNDVLASKIASNGQAFAKTTLGEKEKMIGFAGVLIEYARDWALKRGTMDWSG